MEDFIEHLVGMVDAGFNKEIRKVRREDSQVFGGREMRGGCRQRGEGDGETGKEVSWKSECIFIF